MNHVPHRLALRLAACLTLLQLAAASHAEPESPLLLSGFGTLGLAATDQRDAEFSQSGRLDGVDRSPVLDLDSKIAVQARYKLSDLLTLTAQVISKNRAQGNYKPEIEWAFIRWDANAALSMRVGRLGAPTFMISDARDINYSVLTARPPLDVYGQVPVSHFDGADLTYRFDAGEASWQAAAWAGRSSSKFAARPLGEATLGAYTLDRVIGLNVTAALDNGWSLRLGSVWSRLSVDESGGAAPASLAPSSGAPGLTVAGASPIRFAGLGASYDRGSWLINAEYTRRAGGSHIADTTGWYVSGGYRIGAFIPYVGLSGVRVTDANRINPLQAALGQATPQGGLAAGLQAVLDLSQVSQRTTTLGLRWDAADKVAVKVQWDHMRKPARSFGWFVLPKDAQPAQARGFFESAREANLVSVSLDFIF